MKHYKVTYKLGEHGEHIYPGAVKGVIWQNPHYHDDEHYMVGETDMDVVCDGKSVILLDQKDAHSHHQKIRGAAPKRHKDIFLPD